MGWQQFVDFVAATGRALAELAALLLGVGFLIGALLMTGLAGTLANDLVYLAGGAPLVLLVMGAITSFIFGLGLTVTACYIFLAIVLAPPLVKAGLDPLAIHMFVLYWGMVSFITPPVALAAFAAAPIAQSEPDAESASRRCGSAPRSMSFRSASCSIRRLLLKGDAAHRRGQHRLRISRHRARGRGVAGLCHPDRPHPRTRRPGWLVRALLLAGALYLAIPVERFVGLPMPQAIAVGLALASAGLGLLYWINRKIREDSGMNTRTRCDC